MNNLMLKKSDTQVKVEISDWDCGEMRFRGTEIFY